MSGARIDQTEVWKSLEGVDEKWRRDHNPVDVWYAIKICIDYEASFPPWVLSYLAECGERVLKARFDKSARKDSRHALPEIFRFTGHPGKPSHFAQARDDYEAERYAMAFAASIFAGETPGKAQRRAISQLPPRADGGHDDRTLQRRLKRYFRLNRLPGDKKGWRTALANWFLQQNIVLVAHYREVFPTIPDLVEMLAEAGGGGFTLSGDGKLSRIAAGTKKPR